MLLLMANYSSHTIWYVLAGIAVIGGVAAWKYYKTNGQPHSKPEREGGASSSHGNSEQRQPEGHGVVQLPNQFKYQEQLISIIKHFSGCLNALSDVMDEEDKDSAEVTFRNVELIFDGHADNELKIWFNSFAGDRKSWTIDIYRNKAKDLKQILVDCGLKASTEKKLTWNSEAAKHYRRLMKVEEGQVCDVVAPCWIFKNQIFEQGLVKVSEQ